MTYVFGAVAVCGIGFYLLRMYPWRRPRWDLGKRYFSFASPMLFISLLGVIAVNVDKILIGYFWTADEVGQYFSVQQVLQIVSIIPAAVCTVLFPTLSEYYSLRFFEKIKDTVCMAERYISMVITPIIVVVIVFVNPIIDIMFNSAFLPAASALSILMVYAFISGLTMPYSSLVGGMDKPGITAKICFVTCSLNLVFSFLFIPRQGILSPIGIVGPAGAAFALFLSSLVGFFGLRIVVKKTAEIYVIHNHTLRHVAAGLIMGGVLYIFTIFISVIHWYHLFVFAALGFGIYLAVLIVLKELKKQDLTFFLRLLYPKETLDYVKSELKR
jgi:O-antigen/teichoic acid export membrane protein